MPPVRVPADVDLEDRLAFGLTGRQLAILAATLACAYAVEALTASLAPRPLALAAAALVGGAGLMLAIVRRGGLRGEALALAAARHLLAPRRLVLAPDGLPGALPGPRLRLGLLEPPVVRVRASGVVELADGSHCRILRARGTSFALRSPEEQAAYVAAFGRCLNGLAEPLQIVVRRESASLEGHAEAVERAASELPGPARAAAAEHARFLRALGGGETPLWRRSILVVVSSRDRAELAEAALERAAAQATELLRGAEVSLSALDGAETAALLARVIAPPGPPPGSHLEGVIHANAPESPAPLLVAPRSAGASEPGAHG